MRLKWTTPEEKEWWFTKLSAVRRSKLHRLSESQNHRCCYCGTHTWLQVIDRRRRGRPKHMKKWQMATLEHVQAQTHGGTDSLWNLVMSCVSCNRTRGSSMDAVEFYELFKNKTVWAERQAVKNRIKAQENAERNRARQLAYNMRVWEIALLCHAVPGLWDLLVSAINHARVLEFQRREQRREEQRILRLAA